MIGILGGGQLGRMLALAGVPLGLPCRCLDPAPDAPAGAVAELVVGPYTDETTLGRLAQCDAVTYEFENVPLAAVEWLAARVPVWPPPRSLATAQDRLEEKRCFDALGIPTPAYEAVDDQAGLEAAVTRLGLPAVLKTRRLGYDGKGQRILRSDDDVRGAFAGLGGVPCLLERLVPFVAEASVLVARDRAGGQRLWPLVENEHRGGTLRRSRVVGESTLARWASAAERAGRAVADELGHVGVLALELFLTEDGVLANEIAPRVHNSGHWTIEGAATSQFENHLRAVTGLPLGDTAARGPVAMLNAVGGLPEVPRVLEVADAHLHLYGKEPRPGRKVAHVTVRAPDEGALGARLAALEPLVPFLLP